MLVSLTISNFTVVKHLSLDFYQGFSAVTGETGAGKSITMDALSLCLGERADPKKVRKGEKQAQITAVFDTQTLPLATQYLQEHGFANDGECIVRRVISAEGRSKAYINAHPATLTQLQQLGEHLASICGQHTQYALLNTHKQRELLDQYGQHGALLNEMHQAHTHHQAIKQTYDALVAAQQEQEDKRQLLTFQVDELNTFSPIENEYESLDDEIKRLSNGQTLISQGQAMLYQLRDCEDGNVSDQLRTILKSLDELSSLDNALAPLNDSLNSALAEVEDSANELDRYVESVDLDPARLAEVEQRYGDYNDLGRKYKIAPEQLFAHHASLLDELRALDNGVQTLEETESKLNEAYQQMLSHANTLSEARNKAAQALSEGISAHMPHLGMEHGQCQFTVRADLERGITAQGYDHISILIQTNPGESLGELGKVASGGELSRVSLIIQLAIAQKHTTPTLVFDEVDVGISGPTASVVGKMLKTLGLNTQVISITHLAQVASKANQHYYVCKHLEDERTTTEMRLLDPEGRVGEIARLVGGEHADEEALANARALLGQKESAVWSLSLSA